MSPQHFRYHEWYTRALRGGYTHIDIPDDDNMCNDTWTKVHYILRFQEM